MSAKNIKKKIMYVLGGNILAEDIIVKNTRFIVVFIVILILYISNRFSCIDKMSQIENLQRELRDVKYESLTISAKLIGVSRETKVESLVKSKGVDIKLNTEPVYKVK